MEIKNQRGQVLAEFILTILLFSALLTAAITMATHQREYSNKYKISKSVQERR